MARHNVVSGPQKRQKRQPWRGFRTREGREAQSFSSGGVSTNGVMSPPFCHAPIATETETGRIQERGEWPGFLDLESDGARWGLPRLRPVWGHDRRAGTFWRAITWCLDPRSDRNELPGQQGRGFRTREGSGFGKSDAISPARAFFLGTLPLP